MDISFSSILLRRGMFHFFEHSVQAADIVVSYGGGDLVDLLIGLFQKDLCVFQANLIQVIFETLALFFLENMAEVAAVHVEQGGYKFHGNIFLVVVVDVGFYVYHNVGIRVNIVLLK